MQTRKLKKWALAGAIVVAGYGTAAMAQDQDVDQGMGGSGTETMTHEQSESFHQQSTDINNPDLSQQQPPVVAPETNVTVETGQPGAISSSQEMSKREMRRQNKELKPSSASNFPGIITVGGGLEGQTGDLADALRPGPTWGAQVAVQPLSVMGIEGQYTGATSNVDTRISGGNNNGLANGADVVRNGAAANVTLLAPTPVIQPYALGGVGIDWYDYRGTAPVLRDDTAGRVPLGGGLKANLGQFVADARGTYNILFSDNLVQSNPGRGGLYDFSLNLGARF